MFLSPFSPLCRYYDHSLFICLNIPLVSDAFVCVILCHCSLSTRVSITYSHRFFSSLQCHITIFKKSNSQWPLKSESRHSIIHKAFKGQVISGSGNSSGGRGSNQGSRAWLPSGSSLMMPPRPRTYIQVCIRKYTYLNTRWYAYKHGCVCDNFQHLWRKKLERRLLFPFFYAKS